MTALSMVERVAFAMAEAEGNGQAQMRAIANNHDVLGYAKLAIAAVDECLRCLAENATDDGAT